MRIGIVCHSSCGGSGRIAGELSVGLAQRGHRVHLFARNMPFGVADTNRISLHRTAKETRDNDPTVLHVDWSIEELETLLDCIVRVTVEESLDLLHIHYLVPFAFIAEELKSRLGKRTPLLIATLHGTDVTVHGRHPVTGPLLSRMLRAFDGLSTVSFNHSKVAGQVFGLPYPPAVIPNFIELTRFSSLSAAYTASSRSKKQRTQDLNGKAVICHVSNFRSLKNPESVARIFYAIRRKIDSELWLVGDGPEMEKLRSFVARTGIEADVRYLGLQKEVVPILARADLLLMTSTTESFCLAALEAMACGVPVLATEVGGLPEVVVHQKTGFLFPLGQNSIAVEFATQLLSNPSMHAAMKKAAAIHARKFSRETIVRLYENFYQGLIYKSVLRRHNRAETSLSARGQRLRGTNGLLAATNF